MSMINCPKCGFFQPKDQYCASCGVNMEKWQAPKQPLWKKVAGNWMFQLSVLFIIIFVLILNDSFNEREPVQTLAETPRLRRKSLPPPEERDTLERVEGQSLETPAKKLEMSGAAKVEKFKAQPLGSLKEANKLQGAAAPLQKKISARIYFVPKNNIASILNFSSRVDENIGTLHKKSFENYRKKKKGWTSLDSISQSFEFNEPQTLFSGQSFTETGKNLGFYFQVTVLEEPGDTISFELKTWSELKPTTEGSETLSYEVSMKRKHALVLSQFAPKGLNFTEEEASFIDNARKLRPINSARFIEDFNDLILVLEIL